MKNVCGNNEQWKVSQSDEYVFFFHVTWRPAGKTAKDFMQALIKVLVFCEFRQVHNQLKLSKCS